MRRPLSGGAPDSGIGMVEAVISLAFVALFSLVAWATGADPDGLIWGGIGLSMIGFAYGIPTAIVYHWLLYRALVEVDRLPARWWLSPTSHHGLVPREQRRWIYLWGMIGGTGFLVIVLGILLTSVGLWQLLV